MTPRRPVTRYHGGKWRIAPWIISHFPEHSVYVEPFCGAASVLMRKPPARAEVLNDLDGEVCNVFRVLRDPDSAAELERRIRLTPFARDEFLSTYCDFEGIADPIERARLTLVRGGMGYGSGALRKNRTGFRGKCYSSRRSGAQDWVGYPDHIASFCERLSGVVIENTDAFALLPRHDSPESLFYVDPPYPHQTRSSLHHSGQKVQYLHELSNWDHQRLAVGLRELRGMVVLSGYPCELYDDLFGDWMHVEKETMADCGQRRTEMLWLNPAAEDRLADLKPDLFRGNQGVCDGAV